MKKALKSSLSLKFLLGFFCIIVIILIVFFSIDLLKNYREYSNQRRERTNIQAQIKTWQSITEKFKGYKDGFLQLATLEYRLGEYEKTKSYLNQALYLDPNYKEALELQNRLKNY
jgi:tetratricopeptide (TPR) repeat protein